MKHLIMIEIKVASSSGYPIPHPFNENDITVWNALICKYLCKENRFNKANFLQSLIDDKIEPSGGYYKNEMKSYFF